MKILMLVSIMAIQVVSFLAILMCPVQVLVDNMDIVAEIIVWNLFLAVFYYAFSICNNKA